MERVDFYDVICYKIEINNWVNVYINIICVWLKGVVYNIIILWCNL